MILLSTAIILKMYLEKWKKIKSRKTRRKKEKLLIIFFLDQLFFNLLVNAIHKNAIYVTLHRYFCRLILAFVNNENEFLWRGFFYVFLLIVVAILQMLFLNYHFYIMNRTGLQIRTALVSLIYKKVNSSRFHYNILHVPRRVHSTVIRSFFRPWKYRTERERISL